MRRLFVTLMTVFCFTTFVNAQVEYGIRGGLNMSNLEGDVENTENYYSFHIGFFTSFKITDRLSIQPEIQYSSQGADYEYTFSEADLQGSEDGELRFQYLNLPVMFKFDIAKGFFVQAGPQAGYLAHSKQVTNYIEKQEGNIVYQDYSSRNLRKFTNEIDYGVTAGIGYQFKDGLFAEVRYYYGLNDVIKDMEENRNSVFQFSIGYRF